MSSKASLKPYAFALDLWHHRELLWQFTLRNIGIRHKGSHLGLVWAVLNPLLMLALYVFVFGFVFGGKFNVAHPESRIEYALGIFLGLTIFNYFSETFAIAPSVIISNPNFVKKVVFPLEILPASNVFASMFYGLMSLVLAVIGVATLGPGLSLASLWLFPLLLCLILLLLGTAWLVSAVGVFFRDVNQLTGFLTMALMFGSAVFYPASSIPPSAWAFLKFNPLLLSVEIARDILLWHRAINLQWMIYLACISLIVCILGYWCFRKASSAFADVL